MRQYMNATNVAHTVNVALPTDDKPGETKLVEPGDSIELDEKHEEMQRLVAAGIFTDLQAAGASASQAAEPPKSRGDLKERD